MSEIGLIISVTNYKTQSMPVGNVPSERLKIMLNEIIELLNLVTQSIDFSIFQKKYLEMMSVQLSMCLKGELRNLKLIHCQVLF